MPLEMAGEMSLVVKADGGGHIGGRSALEQKRPGHVDAAAGQVAVRAEAELAGEAADEVGNAAVERGGRLCEAHLVCYVIVEEQPERAGEARFRCRGRARCPGEVAGDPLADQREPGFGIQAHGIMAQAVMQPG